MIHVIAMFGLAAICAPDGRSAAPGKIRVAIATDATELLQCDPIRIQCIITNHTGSDVFLRRHPALPSYRFVRFEIKRNGQWSWLCVMADIRLRHNGNGYGGDGSGSGRLVLDGVSYSECAYAIVDEDGKWVFDSEGQFRIRACVCVGDVDVISNEVEITVGKRSADSLSHAKKMLSTARQLEIVSLQSGLPKNYNELRKCGGNLEELAKKVGEFEKCLAEREKGGGKDLMVEVLNRLREGVDAVTYEAFISVLGRSCYERNDIEGLRAIESRMETDSTWRRIFKYELRQPSFPHEYTRHDFGGSGFDAVKSE